MELVRRAGVHAALGDLNRLAIVDALHLSDRSPSELAALLGIGSNLLAHHLQELEELGIVARMRSEGDRRRRYIRLVPAALSDLLPRRQIRARRIVFVCTENSARSPLAQAIWNERHPVDAISAGINPAGRLRAGTRRTASRRGLALDRTCPKPMPALEADDLVVSVCDRSNETLASRSDIHLLHWSVPDPAAAGHRGAYDRTAEEIADRIDALAPHLVAE